MHTVNPGSRPAAAPRLRLLFVGLDELVWTLLQISSLVAAERAECGLDGACPIYSPGRTDGTLRFDAVLVDDRPGPATPAAVVAWLRKTAPSLPIIQLSRLETDADIAALDDPGVDELVVKNGLYRLSLLTALRRITHLHTAGQQAGVAAQAHAEDRRLWESARHELELRAARHDAERSHWDAAQNELLARLAKVESAHAAADAARENHAAAAAALSAQLADAARTHHADRERWEEVRADLEQRLVSAEADLAEARQSNAAADAERRDLETRLVHLLADQERLHDCALFGWAVTSLDGLLLRCNDAFAGLFDYDSADAAVQDMSGTPFAWLGDSVLVHPGTVADQPQVRVAEQLTTAQGRRIRITQWIGLKTGSDVEPDRLERILIDVTELYDYRDELRASHRLEALGELTVQASTDLQRLVDGDSEAGRIVAQLAAFARRQARPLEPVELDEAIERVASRVSDLAGDDAVFVGTLAARAAVITTTDDLDQMLTTLFITARNQLPAGGRVVVRTEVPTRLPSAQHPIDSGPGVRLTVCAEGYGVQPPIRTAALDQVVGRCGGNLRLTHPDERRIAFVVDLPQAERRDDRNRDAPVEPD